MEQMNLLIDLIKKSEFEGKLERMLIDRDGKEWNKEWVVVDFSDLSKIFGIGVYSLRIKLTKMGYNVRQRYNKFYFARKKEQEEFVEDGDLDKIKEEIEQLEKFKLGDLSKKQLCRLVNLRKICAVRKGDRESLLIGDFADKQFVYCDLSKYEELRLGFKLLFKEEKNRF